MLDNMDNGSKWALRGKAHEDAAKKASSKALARQKEIAAESRRERRCTVQKNTKQMWKFATSMTTMRERTIVREMMLICIVKARKKKAAPAEKKPSTVAPVDPCKKWKAEHKANKEISKALKAEVKFGGGSTVLKASGKTTLNGVAKILNKYPWMSI